MGWQACFSTGTAGGAWLPQGVASRAKLLRPNARLGGSRQPVGRIVLRWHRQEFAKLAKGLGRKRGAQVWNFKYAGNHPTAKPQRLTSAAGSLSSRVHRRGSQLTPKFGPLVYLACPALPAADSSAAMKRLAPAAVLSCVLSACSWRLCLGPRACERPKLAAARPGIASRAEEQPWAVLGVARPHRRGRRAGEE